VGQISWALSVMRNRLSGPSEMGFAGQIKLGLEANTKLDLVGQYGFGLGRPVQN